jgi:hypothetical protein
MLSWLRRRGACSDERGVVMVAFAILLVVILGVAALVVDIGFVSEKTRQIQTSADAAALAAAQSLPTRTAAVATAQSYAQQNLPDGTFPWSSCTDSGRPAGWTFLASNPCVSFDTSFTKVKVRLPFQSYPTMFGRVLNVASLGASRSATARIVAAGFGSIQPFALYSGFGAGLSCLKEGPSGHKIATCDDPTTGNFTLLDITQYGNDSLQTPTRCGNSFQRDRMIDNIAIGADHLFSTYTGTQLLDGCGQDGPNTIPPRTGNDVAAFDTGMVHGVSTDTSDGGGARLKRGQYPKATVLGQQLDNKPLWQFIPTGLPTTGTNAVPNSCRRETFDTIAATPPTSTLQVRTTAALEQCFTDYEAGNYNGVVFGANTNPFTSGQAEVPIDLFDVQLSPRFAYVPQFVQSVPPGGSSSNLNIASFRAVYIEDIYADCNSGCNVDFAPGPWNTGSLGNSNKNAEAMTAWVFDNKMLPSSLRGDPSSVGQNNYVQLIK